ncbi:translation initiation factor IF-2-like [Apodemus sylvaticus]|uniref:translation initiation factor IF-2-like n=1 Tax=Apodemus sylvaticus TaxID=10129 RepID=UPI00224447FA|nr:translation initiation factor IF-2-like [Apodemus sylvaticus]
MSGRGRAAARRAGARAVGGRAGGGQPRHQDSAHPRRLAAPPRYWRRRSRAISLRHHRLGSAGAEVPTTGRQREAGGGGERPCSGPRGERTPPAPSLLLLRRRLPSSPPPPPGPSRRLLPLLQPPPLHQLHPGNSDAAAFGKARQFPPHPLLPTPRGSRTPPSANLGLLPPSSSSEAWAPSPATRQALPVAAFLTLESGHSRSTLGVVVLGSLREAGPGASGLRGVGATFGRRTVGREGRHLGPNAERRELRVRPEAQRRRGRGALREAAASPAPRAPCGGRKAPNWAAGTVVAEARRGRGGSRPRPTGRTQNRGSCRPDQCGARACGTGLGTADLRAQPPGATEPS